MMAEWERKERTRRLWILLIVFGAAGGVFSYFSTTLGVYTYDLMMAGEIEYAALRCFILIAIPFVFYMSALLIFCGGSYTMYDDLKRGIYSYIFYGAFLTFMYYLPYLIAM